MLTIADVGPDRRRPMADRKASRPATAPLQPLVDPARALVVSEEPQRTERLRLEEALARLPDGDLAALHSLTERTLGLTDRGAAAYSGLARGLALIEAQLTDRNLRGRRLGRRIDPLCTARERLKAVTAPVWSDHVAAMHLLVEAAERAGGGEGRLAAEGVVAAARAAPQEFGRPKKKRQTPPDWEAITAALADLLALAAERKAGGR